MDFYYVTDDYIKYLKQFDNKVSDNKSGTRPYVGIVLNLGEIKYFAPFTSPKEKHLSMKNGVDFRKIDQGRLGAINFNNMIPVPEISLIRLVINEIQDRLYQKLLLEQFHCVNLDSGNIMSTAKKLRAMFDLPEESLSRYQRSVRDRCCNFILLEEKSKLYTCV